MSIMLPATTHLLPGSGHTPRRRTIAIAADTYPSDVNGAAYFTYRLAVGLARRGNTVHVIRPSETGPAHTVTDVDGVTAHHVRSRPILLHPTMRFSTPLAARRALGAILDAIGPDVVHAQSHFPIGRSAIRAAVSRHIPVVATNHFMPDNLLHHVRVPNAVSAVVSARAWRDAATVFGRADHVTTPTPLAAEVFARNGFTGAIDAVSCGIDLTRFSPRAAPAHQYRRGFGLPDVPTVLYVGRLDAEKHIDELIRAIGVTATPAQLVVAGTGPDRAALTAFAADLGVSERVHFLGFVPDEDLPDLYRAADVFAIAGRAELQSIVTLEAMASGLPVVAADAVALPHLVDDGANGYLFTPGDSDDIAKRLDAVLCSRAETEAMGAHSRQMALEHDDTRSLVRFESIYDRLAPALGGAR